MGKGRSNRSAITTGEAVKLNIDKLVKDKCIIIGAKVSFISSWTNGTKINVISIGSENEMYIRLLYSQTNNSTNEIKSFDYNVYIENLYI